MKIPSAQNVLKNFKNPGMIGLSLVAVLCLVVTLITLFQYRSLQQTNEDLRQEVIDVTSTQVDARNRMRDLYENQQADFDSFDSASQNLVDSIQDYLLETNRTVRFIDGQADGLPTADEERFEQREQEVEDEINRVEVLGQQVVQESNRIQELVDEIYISLGEDPNNRANPDGIR